MDNDPNKSIRSIIRDMGVFEFLMKLVVHEDIHYFSCQMRKGQSLSHAMKNKRKDSVAKLLNTHKHPVQSKMIWFFSDEKKFLQGSEGEFTKQLLVPL